MVICTVGGAWKRFRDRTGSGGNTGAVASRPLLPPLCRPTGSALKEERSFTVRETGLIVVVDSVKPTIEIDLREAAPGRVALDWTIIDDGVEGYLSQRLDKYGKPVCSGVAPPNTATGLTP